MRSRRLWLVVAVLLVVFPLISSGSQELLEGKTIFIGTKGLYRLEINEATGRSSIVPLVRPSTTTSYVDDIVIGPDRLLYASQPFLNRIVRCDQNGQNFSIILEDRSFAPSDLAFDMAGNLYFSNRNSLARCGGGTNDVYVITDVTSGVRPRLVVPSAKFSDRHQGSCGNTQVLFLTSGPYSGDLLLTEAKVAPIARAEAPEFSVIVPLISDEVDGDNWHVVASTDEFLLVTDYENGRILRYDLEGNYIDVFVRKRNVNWITTDSEGLVYATTCSQWWLGSQGFFIFSPEGEQVFTYPIQHAFSIAVLEE